MPWPNDPQGPQARVIADLYGIMFAAAVVVLAIVVGALVIAGLKYRERPGHVAKQYHGHNLLELIWTVIPTLMVITFGVLSFQRLVYINDIDSGAAMTIKVEARQWVWTFQYPEEAIFKLSDGTYLQQGEEVHIPVGQKVKLELSSKDVIHSFFIPSLGGKKDAVPGRATALWIQADRPGTYKGQCTEFCGTGHADMLLTVVAQNPSDYAAWAADAKKAADLLNDPATKKGKDLFLSLACAGCHTIQGTSAVGKVGPDLSHLASQQTPVAGVAALTPVNEENLKKWINDPPANKPGTLMPKLGLDADTVDAIVKFLLTLK